MATHKSSEKRARQTPKRTSRKVQVRKAARTAEKKLVDAVAGKAKDLQTTLSGYVSQMMKAVSKGAIDKKTASRKIGRMTKRATPASNSK